MHEVTGTFIKLSDWNHEIDHAVALFHAVFKCYPNIILTSEPTAKRLDALLSLELFEKGEKEFVQTLGHFCTKDYELQFCVEAALGFKEYILIFDDQAEFIDPDEKQPVKEKEVKYAYAS